MDTLDAHMLPQKRSRLFREDEPEVTCNPFRKETTGPVDFPVRSEERTNPHESPRGCKDLADLLQVQRLRRPFSLKHQALGSAAAPPQSCSHP